MYRNDKYVYDSRSASEQQGGGDPQEEEEFTASGHQRLPATGGHLVRRSPSVASWRNDIFGPHRLGRPPVIFTGRLYVDLDLSSQAYIQTRGCLHWSNIEAMMVRRNIHIMYIQLSSFRVLFVY